MRGEFNFLHAGIWFDVTKCEFIIKNSSFKMLVVFSPIFVADTKITFVCNFVAPVTVQKNKMLTLSHRIYFNMINFNKQTVNKAITRMCY